MVVGYKQGKKRASSSKYFKDSSPSSSLLFRYGAISHTHFLFHPLDAIPWILGQECAFTLVCLLVHHAPCSRVVLELMYT